MILLKKKFFIFILFHVHGYFPLVLLGRNYPFCNLGWLVLVFFISFSLRRLILLFPFLLLGNLILRASVASGLLV